ncbi:MAG: hypothetical protein R3E39_14495 [Anaerolineae bacterium]
MIAPLLPLLQSGGPTDWDRETDLARSIREYLEGLFADRNMTLDFRRINGSYDQEFKIQIKADFLYPVASCFKAWIALYYYINTPSDQWQDTEGTSLYSTVVFSSNTETGVVLAEVARRRPGDANPIVKFNDFLMKTVGMASGLHSWDWPGSPTVGFTDERFAPSDNRGVTYNGDFYRVDNLFSATDMAHGYDVLVRGEVFARWQTMKDAIAATSKLLSIRAPEYQSPLEFVAPDGYMGKDGVLPETDLPSGLGRVINDAGVLTVGDARYIIAFMAIGENETNIRAVLTDIVKMIGIYERGRPSLATPLPTDGPGD